MNTPIEALEYAYPFRITHYGLRQGTGGAGKHQGGDGVVREIEFLYDAKVTILSDRRQTKPYGLAGGVPGNPGRNILIREGKEEGIPGKVQLYVRAQDRLRIETPGGGGYGTEKKESNQ